MSFVRVGFFSFFFFSTCILYIFKESSIYCSSKNPCSDFQQISVCNNHTNYNNKRSNTVYKFSNFREWRNRVTRETIESKKKSRSGRREI